jgi:hypothetical protein
VVGNHDVAVEMIDGEPGFLVPSSSCSLAASRRSSLDGSHGLGTTAWKRGNGASDYSLKAEATTTAHTTQASATVR